MQRLRNSPRRLSFWSGNQSFRKWRPGNPASDFDIWKVWSNKLLLGCSCYRGKVVKDNIQNSYFHSVCISLHLPNRELNAVSLIQDPVAFGAAARRHVRRRTQNGVVRIEVVQVAPIGGAFDPATRLLIQWNAGKIKYNSGYIDLTPTGSDPK